MPYTVYQKYDFLEIKRVNDPRWAKAVADITDPEEAQEDLTVLRVMLLSADRLTP
jgi:hypothetical protein